MLAGEHVVERLLESLTSLCFWPKRFVVINDTVGIASGFPGVTDYLAGKFSARVNAHVNRPHNCVRRQIIFYLFVLRLVEILCDLQRHDSAIAIVSKDRLVRNPQPAPEQISCLVDLFAGETDSLCVGKI